MFLLLLWVVVALGVGDVVIVSLLSLSLLLLQLFMMFSSSSGRNGNSSGCCCCCKSLVLFFLMHCCCCRLLLLLRIVVFSVVAIDNCVSSLQPELFNKLDNIFGKVVFLNLSGKSKCFIIFAC